MGVAHPTGWGRCPQTPEVFLTKRKGAGLV